MGHAFTTLEYDRRAAALQAQLAQANLDAFLAFTSCWFRAPGAVCYCCGYEPVFGSAAFLFLPATFARHLLVNNAWDVVGRPEEKDREREEFHLVEDLGAETARLLPPSVRRLGIVNQRSMPAPIYDSLRQALSGVETVGSWEPFNAVREVKSAEELALLRRNAAVSDAGAGAFFAAARPGASERDVAAEVLYTARRAGADGFWTPVSVASGPRAAMYYALPTERKMEEGDTVHMDLGVMAGGYHGDIQRARLLPGRRSAEREALVSAVHEIQEQLVQTIRPGLRAADVAQMFVRLSDECGLGQYRHRGTGPAGVGHGIGSDGHESPDLRLGDETPLRAGMVVTLEPMLFIDGVGGAGVEDMVLITPQGGQRLTHASRAWA